MKNHITNVSPTLSAYPLLELAKSYAQAGALQLQACGKAPVCEACQTQANKFHAMASGVGVVATAVLQNKHEALTEAIFVFAEANFENFEADQTSYDFPDLILEKEG